MGRHTGILSIAASALGANALLLPPNIASGDLEALKLTPGAFNAKQAAVSLPCPDCQFRGNTEEKTENIEGDEPLFWIQGGANNVVVNFTISEDGKKLSVNGGTVWPLFQVSDLLVQRTYVSQVASGTSVEDVAAGKADTLELEVTSSRVSVMDREVVSPEGDVLIPLRHTIFELQGQPVSLDSIFVKLIKAKSGELFIAQVQPEKALAPRPDDLSSPHGVLVPLTPHHEDRPHQGADRQRECDMPAALCKLKSMVEDRLRGMREGGLRKGWMKPGCHGLKGSTPHVAMMHGHIKPLVFRPGQEDGAPHHDGRPVYMRPHLLNHHEHHHFMHSFIHGLFAVLIPTLAGIAVGMAVSLVGLFVGRLISFLWIKFYRGGRRGGYQSVQLDETDGDEAQSGKMVIVVEDDTEPLPVYEESPAYEEVLEKEAH